VRSTRHCLPNADMGDGEVFDTEKPLGLKF
jgi:hypothetical protein